MSSPEFLRQSTGSVPVEPGFNSPRSRSNSSSHKETRAYANAMASMEQAKKQLLSHNFQYAVLSPAQHMYAHAGTYSEKEMKELFKEKTATKALIEMLPRSKPAKICAIAFAILLTPFFLPVLAAKATINARQTKTLRNKACAFSTKANAIEGRVEHMFQSRPKIKLATPKNKFGFAIKNQASQDIQSLKLSVANFAKIVHDLKQQNANLDEDKLINTILNKAEKLTINTKNYVAKLISNELKKISNAEEQAIVKPETPTIKKPKSEDNLLKIANTITLAIDPTREQSEPFMSQWAQGSATPQQKVVPMQSQSLEELSEQNSEPAAQKNLPPAWYLENIENKLYQPLSTAHLNTDRLEWVNTVNAAQQNLAPAFTTWAKELATKLTKINLEAELAKQAEPEEQAELAKQIIKNYLKELQETSTPNIRKWVKANRKYMQEKILQEFNNIKQAKDDQAATIATFSGLKAFIANSTQEIQNTLNESKQSWKAVLKADLSSTLLQAKLADLQQIETEERTDLQNSTIATLQAEIDTLADKELGSLDEKIQILQNKNQRMSSQYQNAVSKNLDTIKTIRLNIIKQLELKEIEEPAVCNEAHLIYLIDQDTKILSNEMKIQLKKEVRKSIQKINKETRQYITFITNERAGLQKQILDNLTEKAAKLKQEIKEHKKFVEKESQKYVHAIQNDLRIISYMHEKNLLDKMQSKTLSKLSYNSAISVETESNLLNYIQNYFENHKSIQTKILDLHKINEHIQSIKKPKNSITNDEQNEFEKFSMLKFTEILKSAQSKDYEKILESCEQHLAAYLSEFNELKAANVVQHQPQLSEEPEHKPDLYPNVPKAQMPELAPQDQYTRKLMPLEKEYLRALQNDPNVIQNFNKQNAHNPLIDLYGNPDTNLYKKEQMA